MRFLDPHFSDRRTPRRTRAVLAAALLGSVLATAGVAAGPAEPALADVPVETITVGAIHTCAVLTTGQARCWGSNGKGQLGNGTTLFSPVPTTVIVSGAAPLTGVRQISAGESHTCAVLTSGQARCWGNNGAGQLGDGTTIQRTDAVAVTSLDGTPLTGVAEVDAGANHTCARMTDGTARCWGLNATGQLGNGTTLQRLRAVTVTSSGGAPLTDVLEISAGFVHSCARTGTNLRCWGGNGNGQVGDGSTTQRNNPVFVRNSDATPLANVAEVVTGAGQHTCARTTDRTARCWGANIVGQLGDGSTVEHRSPAFVRSSDGTPLGSIDHLAAGDGTTCARTTDGTSRCWGSNNRGQVGDASTTTRLNPVFVRQNGGAPLAGIAQIATANEHSCARMTDRTVRCWGEAGGGETGDDLPDLRRPVPVGALDPPTPFVGGGAGDVVSVGTSSTCALTADTGVQCWGANSRQQSGSGSFDGFRRSTRVVAQSTLVPLSTVTQVASGAEHHCARLADGTARCWGYNAVGQVGDGTTIDPSAAVTVENSDGSPLTAVAGVGLGALHSCAVQTDGRVRCWGLNGQGQVGDGSTTQRNNPVFVRNSDATPLTGVAQVVAGFSHTCARMTDGTVRCWGDNFSGQIGDGSTSPRRNPVFVRNSDGTPMTGVTSLSSNSDHTCARLSSGQVRCWGGNSGGSIGDGSTTDRPNPVFVRNADGTPLVGVAQVAVGQVHGCARMTDGTVRCWGDNGGYGLIGDGGDVPRLSPVFVRNSDGTPMTGAAHIASSSSFNCARLTTGGVRCWGANSKYQLGDGTTTSRSRPVTALSGPLGGVA